MCLWSEEANWSKIGKDAINAYWCLGTFSSLIHDHVYNTNSCKGQKKFPLLLFDNFVEEKRRNTDSSTVGCNTGYRSKSGEGVTK